MSASGTVATTLPDNNDRANRPIQKWVVTWTTTAGGAFSQLIGTDVNSTGTAAGCRINGTLVAVETIPGTGGSQPSSYGLTLINDQGRDVLGGLGVTRSTTVTEVIAPVNPVTVNSIQYPRDVVLYDTLTLNVTSAGNSKSGTVVLYVR